MKNYREILINKIIEKSRGKEVLGDIYSRANLYDLTLKELKELSIYLEDE